MKKLFSNSTKVLILLTIAYFALLPITSAVSATWTKGSINPITSSLQLNHVTSASVIKNHDKYIFFMSANSGNGWNIFKSELREQIWSESKSDLISVGSEDDWEDEVSDPEVLKINNEYRMWYTSTNTDHWISGEDRFRTRYATSIDGSNWNISDGWVLTGDSNNWDAGGTSRGRSIIYKDNVYHMWYTATNTNSLASNPYWRIGYATSLDGLIWEKQNNGNPVLQPTEVWELNNVSYPNVIFDHGKYKMWYAAGNEDLPTTFVYAESIDGINWTKPSSMNPVFSITADSFDSQYLAEPFVLKDGNSLKMYYSGYDGSKWAIGYASKDLVVSTVPLLKQTSVPWSDDVYDKANLWASANPSIHRWGCAITSAAMILQYHGYSKLPNGDVLDPGSLNKWMSSQSDGYVGPGLVNWIALTRLSKLAADVNNISEFEALEFSSYGRNNALLSEDLINSHPAILSQPGHFIVATAQSGDTYTINDPFYDRNTLNDGYNNTYNGLYRFTKSNTNLSYLMFSFPTDIQLQLRNENGEIIGESFTENAIVAPDDLSVRSGFEIKTHLLPKPVSGTYTINIKSDSPKLYSVNIFQYDPNGNYVNENIVGLSDNQYESFTITYDKNQINNSKVSKNVSYTSILNDLNGASKNKLISKNAYKSLKAIIESAEKDSQKKNIISEKLKLYTAGKLINKPFGKFIVDSYQTILESDLKTLSSTQ